MPKRKLPTAKAGGLPRLKARPVIAMQQHDLERLALLYQMIDATERRIASLLVLLDDDGPHESFLAGLLRDERLWLASLRMQAPALLERTV